MTIEQITKEALSLPSQARAILADQLVESLDPSEEGPFREVWVAEALRRRDEVRSGTVKTISREEGMKRVRRAVEG
jgi:putative addiction module component (TIGR02574 family)